VSVVVVVVVLVVVLWADEVGSDMGIVSLRSSWLICCRQAYELMIVEVEMIEATTSMIG